MGAAQPAPARPGGRHRPRRGSPGESAGRCQGVSAGGSARPAPSASLIADRHRGPGIASLSWALFAFRGAAVCLSLSPGPAGWREAAGAQVRGGSAAVPLSPGWGGAELWPRGDRVCPLSSPWCKVLRGRSLLAASTAGGVGSCGGEAFSRVFDTAGAKGRLEGETGKKKLLSLSAYEISLG